jgi:hypothetical protein
MGPTRTAASASQGPTLARVAAASPA